MVDMSMLAGILSSLNAAKDIGQAMSELRDSAAVQSKVIELNFKIIDAQGRAIAMDQERAALVQKVGDLEKEVGRLKAWGDEKQRYELKEVGTGAFAYVPKPSMQGSEPAHWLCTHCYEDGQKSIMQSQGRTSTGSEKLWKCNRCKGGFNTHWQRGPQN